MKFQSGKYSVGFVTYPFKVRSIVSQSVNDARKCGINFTRSWSVISSALTEWASAVEMKAQGQGLQLTPALTPTSAGEWNAVK